MRKHVRCFTLLDVPPHFFYYLSLGAGWSLFVQSSVLDIYPALLLTKIDTIETQNRRKAGRENRAVVVPCVVGGLLWLLPPRVVPCAVRAKETGMAIYDVRYVVSKPWMYLPCATAACHNELTAVKTVVLVLYGVVVTANG